MNGYVAAGVVLLVVLAVYHDEVGDAAIAAVVNVRDFIKGLEGFSADAFDDDKAGTPEVERSIGYGHQITGKETTQDPEQLLSHDIAAAEAAVARWVVVPLTANQRAALISFVYNVGVTAFAKSTLLRKLNAGDYAGAAAEFDRWVYSGGNVAQGLVARRSRERQLFTS